MTVKLPVYIQDINDRITLINIWVKIVDQLGLPFVLGGSSLDLVCTTLKLTREATVTFNWKKQVDTTISLNIWPLPYHFLSNVQR